MSMMSQAGPDLPVRFSRWSIASNLDSNDPWSSLGESSQDLDNVQSTLTSASFRQRMDKDRSFTASAPPGARPPARDSCKPSATLPHVDDSDGGDERDYGVEPRRDTL